jgi:hypothetical protein
MIFIFKNFKFFFNTYRFFLRIEIFRITLRFACYRSIFNISICPKNSAFSFVIQLIPTESSQIGARNVVLFFWDLFYWLRHTYLVKSVEGNYNKMTV